MPFRFKKKEPVAKAVRRLCRERIDGALAGFKDRDQLKSVHNARKEIKKLRAVLRLVRGKIARQIYQNNSKALRKAADRLTALRDAHVKLNAFEKLAHHFSRQLPARPFPKIKQSLQKNCRVEEEIFLKGDSVPAVKRILRKMKRSADDLKIKSDGWPAIGSGVKEIYRRGREGCKTASKKSSPENFHEWRKRVKDLWYHLRLLSPISPKELRAASDELEKLSEYIGDDHDLEMLKGFVAAKFGSTKEFDAINELICSRQRELRSAALELGSRFYSEKPDVFCKRLGNYWHLWREK